MIDKRLFKNWLTIKTRLIQHSSQNCQAVLPLVEIFAELWKFLHTVLWRLISTVIIGSLHIYIGNSRNNIIYKVEREVSLLYFWLLIYRMMLMLWVRMVPWLKKDQDTKWDPLGMMERLRSWKVIVSRSLERQVSTVFPQIRPSLEWYPQF